MGYPWFGPWPRAQELKVDANPFPSLRDHFSSSVTLSQLRARRLGLTQASSVSRVAAGAAGANALNGARSVGCAATGGTRQTFHPLKPRRFASSRCRFAALRRAAVRRRYETNSRTPYPTAKPA